MKKILFTIGFISCLMMYTTVPVSADNVNGNVNTPGQELRQNVNRGINNTNRALGTDFNQIDRTNNNRATMNTNNYRTTATADDDGFDWGWLGLLGLIGLAGNRSRVSDRDRAK